MARGAAYGDFDHDGDLDVLISTNNGPAVPLPQRRRQSQSLAHVRLAGTKSNRDGIGAVVRVTAPGHAVADGAQRLQLLLRRATSRSPSAWVRCDGLHRSKSTGPAARSRSSPTQRRNQRLDIKEP